MKESGYLNTTESCASVATILDFFNIRGEMHGTMTALLATNNGLHLITRAFYGSLSNKFLKPRGRCIS